MPRFNLNPRKLLVRTTRVGGKEYEKLSGAESQAGSPLFTTPGIVNGWRQRHSWANRLQRPRMSIARMLSLAIVLMVFLGMVFGGIYHRRLPERHKGEEKKLYHWEHYPKLNGFFNGVRTLVPAKNWVSEQEFISMSGSTNPEDNVKPKKAALKDNKEPPLDPIAFNPYPDFASAEYLENHEKVEPCFIDDNDKVSPPNIYAYPGIPQNMTAPFFGSLEELGMNNEVCFERFGRLGPYGYSYSREEGGLGMSGKSESAGADKIWANEKKVDYRDVNWGKAQKKCYQKNKNRFTQKTKEGESENTPALKEGEEAPKPKEKVKRHAYILRTWTGYKYSDYQILTLRAMINELSLKSGGEYDVHFLLHVKDDSIPIWSSKEVYRKTIEDNLPKEFWDMATLWSEQQMKMYYPEPFPNNVYNHAKAPVHSVYRSAHFAMQWFAQYRPDYDFYWNWEMDLRFSGHYYEFHNRIGEWAKQQPRKGIWERSSRYYIPSLHGSWHNFTEMVEEETFTSDEKPVWGPPKFEHSPDGMLPMLNETKPPTEYEKDNYEWGVGEDADLLTFNPIFDPAKTNWVFRDDVSGYNLDLPEPPRRCAIITVSRLSKRLLDIMHNETYVMKHHMFPEMWPPTIAFHHGLKAAYVPHQVYFDHLWPLDAIDGTFNHPPKPTDSVFGWGEHNQLGNSFYYNAAFSAKWWRRWLGAREKEQGGTKEEEEGSGRLCIKPVLFHPVKYEKGAE